VAELIGKLGFFGVDLGQVNEGGRLINIPGGGPELDPARVSVLISVIASEPT
jgi:hypothetical protein